MENEYVLEIDDIQFFKVEEVINESVQEVKITGFSMHSSLGIERIYTKSSQDKIQVIVELSLMRKGIDGNLSYGVIVSDNVNQILFGAEKKVIWNRKNNRGHPPKNGYHNE